LGKEVKANRKRDLTGGVGLPLRSKFGGGLGEGYFRNKVGLFILLIDQIFGDFYLRKIEFIGL